MVQYLKKKRLYEIVTQLMKEKKLPLMKDCEYKFSRGAEWLSFSGTGEDYHYYKIVSQFNGNWIKIEEMGYVNEKSELIVIRSDIYAEPKDGIYQYHSSQNK